MADINIDVYYTGFLFARDERIPSRGRHLSRRCDITKRSGIEVQLQRQVIFVNL